MSPLSQLLSRFIPDILKYVFKSVRELFKPPVIIRSGGGVHNFLYQLSVSSDGSPLLKVEGSNVLGKLQITWRTNLGEPGRLQTQQILGSVSEKLAFHFYDVLDGLS